MMDKYNQNNLYICMYHYTRDLINSRYPNIKGMDINEFRSQMDFFKSQFNVVTMEQVIECVKSDGKIILPENAVLLTFDDGYIDNYTFAVPILEEYGFQGSFFIPGKTFTTHKLLDVNKIHYILASANADKLVVDLIKKIDFYRGKEYDYPSSDELWNQYAIGNRFDNDSVIFIKRMLQTALPERIRSVISSELFEKYVGVTETQLAHELYLTREQINTMKRHGMFIGIHGYDHYWLGDLSEEQMHSDITNALEALDEFIDKDAWVMNYPYGSYNDKVLEFIRSKNACLGLTTKVGMASLWNNNPLELPRLDCNDFPPKSDNWKEIN